MTILFNAFSGPVELPGGPEECGKTIEKSEL
jgi:hypothetical protein